jgi:hypothetical protein
MNGIILTYISSNQIAVSNPAADAACVEICERLFGETENVGHFLACTLYPINAIIHPQRLYTLFKACMRLADKCLHCS